MPLDKSSEIADVSDHDGQETEHNNVLEKCLGDGHQDSSQAIHPNDE